MNLLFWVHEWRNNIYAVAIANDRGQMTEDYGFLDVVDQQD